MRRRASAAEVLIDCRNPAATKSAPRRSVSRRSWLRSLTHTASRAFMSSEFCRGVRTEFNRNSRWSVWNSKLRPTRSGVMCRPSS